MTTTTTAHVNFRGDARAALEFYASVFGGQPTIVTYAQMGRVEQPDEADLVVWGEVASPGGFHVMAYDAPASRGWDRGTDPFFLSVRGDDVEEVTRFWEALSQGATVRSPLAPSPWAPAYGMLTDRFGVTWILDVAAPHGG